MRLSAEGLEGVRVEVLARDLGASKGSFSWHFADREELRHTPGGIPAVAMTLAHRSQQPEADGQREVECELHAVAFGAIACGTTALICESET